MYSIAAEHFRNKLSLIMVIVSAWDSKFYDYQYLKSPLYFPLQDYLIALVWLPL